ncbi:MAG: hypothetical protein J6S67_01825 [Methanobrevibacter sp.]|nr:hypothetical protein [Methanobrevibacter sp.]
MIMNKYEVKRIKYYHEMSFDEYREAIINAPIHICNGIHELRDYCGGVLHYSRNAGGYIGLYGGYSYVARKVGKIIW